MPITRSQKDKLILIDTSGYVYTLRKEGTSKIHWRCPLYRSGTCKAIVHTLPNSDEIIHRYNEHSHPASPELQNSVLINADITNSALGSQENTTAVIDGTIGAGNTIQSTLRSTVTIKRRIQRIRQRNLAAPTSISRLEELIIPEGYCELSLFMEETENMLNMIQG